MKRTITMTVAVWIGLSATAHTQAINAQADALFRQGRDLMAQGKYGEACAAFDASEKLDPAITTILNLGDCREKNGQLATAWAVFLDAERRTRSSADPNTIKLHSVASDHATKLEPRLSKLQITVVEPVAGLVVSRNKEPIDQAVWGRSLPVDGGTYEITASAPNKEPWTATVTLAVEAESKTIDVPALLEKKAAASPTLPPVPPPTPHPHVEPASSRLRYPRLSLGLMTTGGVIAIGGLVVGGLAISKWSDAKNVCGATLECDNEADLDRARSLGKSAYARGNVATGLLVGGAAVSVAGLLMYAFVRDREEQVSVMPQVDGSSTGVMVRASF